MNPATLSIISATFPPRERGTAIGIWVGVSASALAIGPLVGGLLTEHAGWSSIFYVNVPIGAVAIVASFLLIDESRDNSRRAAAGRAQACSRPGIGLFALTYALIEGEHLRLDICPHRRRVRASRSSLSSPSSCSSCASGCPMLDLRSSGTRTFTGANTVVLLVALAMFGVFFFVSLYMQNVLGYSAGPGGRRIPADDTPGHRSSRRRGPALRPRRLALAAQRSGCWSSRCSSCTSRGLASTRATGPCARRCSWAASACRRHDPGDCGRSERRPGRQGGRRLGRPQLVAASRRLDRDRADGGDHDARDRRLADARGVRHGLSVALEVAAANRVRRSAWSRSRSYARTPTASRTSRRRRTLVLELAEEIAA